MMAFGCNAEITWLGIHVKIRVINFISSALPLKNLDAGEDVD